MSSSTDGFNYQGINHVALVARDMAETVDFYVKVLEMPLIKTFDLPDGKGQHFFFDCGNGASIAFFWFPDAPKAVPGISSQHVDSDVNGQISIVTAHASMNHLAIAVPLERMDEYAEKLRAKGVHIDAFNHEDTERHRSTEVNEYTWVRSIYFKDPNGIQLEFAAFTRKFGPSDVCHAPRNEKGELVELDAFVRQFSGLIG
jgi:catechol 2,3-dioxygenase-like lactoylglutathione lyase family enzyme